MYQIFSFPNPQVTGHNEVNKDMISIFLLLKERTEKNPEKSMHTISLFSIYIEAQNFNIFQVYRFILLFLDTLLKCLFLFIYHQPRDFMIFFQKSSTKFPDDVYHEPRILLSLKGVYRFITPWLQYLHFVWVHYLLDQLLLPDYWKNYWECPAFLKYLQCLPYWFY